MRFVAISDTHGKHHQLVLPTGDVIIHAGDISKRGRELEVIDFLNWFKALPFKYKLFVAGNHDFLFERESPAYIEALIPKDVIYICDGAVELEGIKIWGSPITPWFHDWAFNRQRGEHIAGHWNLIPADTNVLITHGPAYGILDKTSHGISAGCEDLLSKITEIKPQVHICGHIHEAYGIKEGPFTKFINASVLDEDYRMVNDPVVFELR